MSFAYSRAIAIFLAAPILTMTAAANADTASAPASSPEKNGSLGEQTRLAVQESLGIPNNGKDILPLIADAVASADKSDAARGAAIAKLVDGLLAGPAPGELLDQILPTLSVDPNSGFQDQLPGWKYGS